MTTVATEIEHFEPLSWVVSPPREKAYEMLGAPGTLATMAATCINITLQTATDQLNKWVNKWLH